MPGAAKFLSALAHVASMFLVTPLRLLVDAHRPLVQGALGRGDPAAQQADDHIPVVEGARLRRALPVGLLVEANDRVGDLEKDVAPAAGDVVGDSGVVHMRYRTRYRFFFFFFYHY